HFNSVDDVLKVLRWNAVEADGRMKSRMNGVAIVALQSALKSSPPVRESPAFVRGRVGTVAEVVGQAQKGVESAHCMPLPAWQDPEGVIKIPRLPPRHLLAIAIGIREGEGSRCHGRTKRTKRTKGTKRTSRITACRANAERARRPRGGPCPARSRPAGFAKHCIPPARSGAGSPSHPG